MPTSLEKIAKLKEILSQALEADLPMPARARIQRQLLSVYQEMKTRGQFSSSQNFKKNNLTFYHSLFKPMIPIIIIAVLLTGGFGTAVAADNSKPGDALYGVDQALEKIQLKLTFSDTNKANLWLKIAQEREQEQIELQSENRLTDAVAAEGDTSRALQNALEVINRVQAKQQSENREQASEALEKVEEKFLEIKNRFTEREKERLQTKLKQTVGKVELKAEIKNGVTKLELKVGENEYKYTLNAINLDAIIDSIQTTTGLEKNDIQKLLKIEEDDEDEDSDDDINTNSNQNLNQNLNKNRNNNVNSSFNSNRNTDSRPEDDDDEAEDENKSNQNRNSGSGNDGDEDEDKD
ncbi:hypothetical protein C4546_01925 [Candidatus Parcubacteria bacterium]|jgi:hypothetical protein|nr:MAG: hypothetical protein C4546_01925 [Candidatus Parcubacteria bacterium]